MGKSKRKNLQFKISSALKDILGRDLITDDYVAVFELVKNSYDAHATRVEVSFLNINSKNPSIEISDNGKGMNYDDLLGKWLFVAYSAKREGTEDKDYINKINQNRIYAGAKGIGRFSCDRLGRNLELTTKVEAENYAHSVDVDWEEFEDSLKTEFGNVDVGYEEIPALKGGMERGTRLVITNLRDEWDREKILGLRNSLAKLINPNKGAQENDFEIIINVPDERFADLDAEEEFEIVNGKIKNFIFEELELKTTQITAYLSSDGKEIVTELLDGGALIYRLFEKNPFDLLKQISITLFYLNQSAKLTFAKRMGVSTTKYGNIFLYKNGFRIYPFGEPGEDPLKVNARYAQGYNRYLGLRNLIGRIEIGQGNPDLKETSSRADGLIKSKAYYQLEDAFWLVLKRLERYIIDVQKWGLGIEDSVAELDEKSRSRALFDLIDKLSDAKDIINVEYGDNFLEILNSAQSDSALSFVGKLKGIAANTQNSELQNIAQSAEKRINQMHSALSEAEKEKRAVSKAKEDIQNELKQVVKQNLLLKSATNEDTVEMQSIEHHVNQATHRVDGYLSALIQGIRDSQNIDYLIDLANNISLENRKISSLVNFVRKANFDTMSSDLTSDLINYIVQYIENVYKEDYIRIVNNTMIDVSVQFESDEEFPIKFVPLEFNIILDNLLDNSQKASAEHAKISLKKISDKILQISYQDDGLGIRPENVDKIFDFGFTTTEKGSGIGLFHVKKIIQDNYAGSIEVLKKTSAGAEFIIKIKTNL